MPSYKAPVKDTLFLLTDVFDYQRYDNLPGFSDASLDIVGGKALNLALLAVSHRKPGVYEKLASVYFAAAVAEDDLPLGRLSYNLMIHARKIA